MLAFVPISHKKDSPASQQHASRPGRPYLEGGSVGTSSESDGLSGCCSGRDDGLGGIAVDAQSPDGS